MVNQRRMKAEKLEYRMYGLVPYNISPIQQAIQFGHAVVEYAVQQQKVHGELLGEFLDWAEYDKTFIILNGGTTGKQTPMNTNLPHGTMNNHIITLRDNEITFAAFCEPDLGNQLTAIVFLVDNRVYDNLKLTPMDLDPHESWYGLMGNEKNEFLHEFLQQFKLA